MVPYRPTPTATAIRVPTAKLRSRMMRRSTIGWSASSSRATNASNAITEITATHRIHTAENQSSSCPLSRMTCSVLSPMAIKPKPT